MNPKCDCKTHASQTTIHSEDNQVSATGTLKLEADGKSGHFEPDSASLTRHALDGNTYPKLIADLGTHQHTLLNVRRLLDKQGQKAWTKAKTGPEVVISHLFEFQCLE
jgi:hypothetical protein